MHKRAWWWRSVALALLMTAISAILPTLSWAEGNWSFPLNLSNSQVDTDGVSVIADGSGRVHVVWSEAGEIRHRYTDGGTWTDANLVSFGGSPRLAADGEGGIHLTFASSLAGSSDIYYTAWQAGTGWGPAVNVSQTAEYSFGPAIAVSGENLAIVWSELVEDASLIYLAESTDGMVWASGPVPGAEGTGATVALHSESLVVAWEDAYDEGLALEIWAAERTSAGWALPIDVSYTPLTNSYFPSLAVGPTGVTLAWEQARHNGSAVFMSNLTDVGWSEGQEVSVGYPAFSPVLSQDESGNVHLAWLTADAVRYRRWDAGQSAWGPAYTVATGLSDVSAVGLAVEEEAHVAWLAEATAGNRDVFYSTRSGPVTVAFLHLPLINR